MAVAAFASVGMVSVAGAREGATEIEAVAWVYEGSGAAAVANWLANAIAASSSRGEQVRSDAVLAPLCDCGDGLAVVTFATPSSLPVRATPASSSEATLGLAAAPAATVVSCAGATRGDGYAVTSAPFWK